jgi:hypothetical protein
MVVTAAGARFRSLSRGKNPCVSSVEPLPPPAAQRRAADEPDRAVPGESANPALGDRVLARIARRRRSGRRRPPVSPTALNEELAAALLYGRRSGSVTASPARPPR